MRVQLSLVAALLVGFSFATFADDKPAVDKGEAFAKVGVPGMT